MRNCLAFTAALLLPAVCLAQTGTVTTPFTPGDHITSASGMPLNDGELPPGTLTVRVVDAGFTANIADHDVVLDVLGAPSRKGRTNADGRALFSDVPVGAHVRAVVSIDDERLESAVFPMPVESGVRVLLATGGVAAPAVSAADEAPGTVPLEMMAAVMRNGNRPVSRPPETPPGDNHPLMAFGLGVSALAFAAFVILRRPKPSRSS